MADITVTVTEQPPVEVQVTDTEAVTTIVEVPSLDVVEVSVPGPAGPTGPEGPEGPAGSGIDAYYQHVQSLASASETITHNLGKFPSISVKDSSGQSVVGNYTYIDVNTVLVEFSSAFSWEALFN